MPRFACILPPDTRLVQRSLCLDQQQALALGLIAPFALSPAPGAPTAPNPDTPWPQLTRLLGEDLDAGWPKLQGELHIAGGWQAPPRQAAQITVQAPGACLSIQLTQADTAAGPFFIPQTDPPSATPYWAGGETIHLQSMHPQHPHLHGVVPALRPRFFVHQTLPDGSHRFAELQATIETLWLLPSLAQGLVVYRALAPTRSAEGHDINALLVALEPSDTPEHPTEHYLQSCVQAMAAHYADDTPGFIPDDGPDSPRGPDNLDKPDGPSAGRALHEEIRQQKLRFQAALAQHGVDDDHVMQVLMANPHTQQFAQLVAQRAGNLSGFFTEIESLLHVIEHGDVPQPPGKNTP
ncbi:DUF2169 domain-containing protein [Castellaniella hirudinis]|uniref:DUF2169 domain-containing protein n=1 Tax=Castellaniella hirudinis TaxID=1144617 RepID=UPI0039C1DCC6